jgi:hypothetical protein
MEYTIKKMNQLYPVGFKKKQSAGKKKEND